MSLLLIVLFQSVMYIFINLFFSNIKERKKGDGVKQTSGDSHVTLKIPKSYLFCALWAVVCGVLVLYVERHQVSYKRVISDAM
jgi:hypothetical protein